MRVSKLLWLSLSLLSITLLDVPLLKISKYADGFNIAAPFSLSVHVKPIHLNLRLGADLNPFLIYSFLTLLPLLTAASVKRSDDGNENTEHYRQDRLVRACYLGVRLGTGDLNTKEIALFSRNIEDNLVYKTIPRPFRNELQKELEVFVYGFHTSKGNCNAIFKN